MKFEIQTLLDIGNKPQYLLALNSLANLPDLKIHFVFFKASSTSNVWINRQTQEKEIKKQPKGILNLKTSID
uniref:Putative ovule protein n=1 Tax=Solanum chacoense TaxID=4108 RepID=A0A0V0HIB4_SOLCH